MSWARPGCTKITRRRNQPPAKMKLPEPIHNDSSRQRILRRCNPVRQSHTPLLLRGLFRQPQTAQYRDSVRPNRLPLRCRLTSKQSMCRPRLLKCPRINRPRRLQLLSPGPQRLQLRQQPLQHLALRTPGSSKIILRLRRRCTSRHSISIRRHHSPFTRSLRHLELILRCQTILKSTLTIPRPHNPTDLPNLRKLKHHPATPRFIRNPAASISGNTVIQMLQLMNRIAGQCSGSRHLHSQRRQSHILPRAVNLQLIHTGLTGIRCRNRPSQKLRRCAG